MLARISMACSTSNLSRHCFFFRHFGRSCGGGGSREPTNLSVNQPQSGDQDQPGRKPSLYSTGKRKYSNSSNVAVTATHANKGTHSHLSPILTKSNSSRQGSKRLLHNKPSLGGGAVTNLSVTKSLSVEDTPSCASSTQCPQGSVRWE